jgi:hypothetical protein
MYTRVAQAMPVGNGQFHFCASATPRVANSTIGMMIGEVQLITADTVPIKKSQEII